MVGKDPVVAVGLRDVLAVPDVQRREASRPVRRLVEVGDRPGLAGLRGVVAIGGGDDQRRAAVAELAAVDELSVGEVRRRVANDVEEAGERLTGGRHVHLPAHHQHADRNLAEVHVAGGDPVAAVRRILSRVLAQGHAGHRERAPALAAVVLLGANGPGRAVDGPDRVSRVDERHGRAAERRPCRLRRRARGECAGSEQRRSCAPCADPPS